MFSLNDSVRYWLYTEPCDMRKSFHTLGGLVRQFMGRDPADGGAYIFLNRRRDRIKILHWEPGGLVLYSKILERGTFGKPSSAGDDTGPSQKVEWSELVLMVEGIVSDPKAKRERLKSPADL